MVEQTELLCENFVAYDLELSQKLGLKFSPEEEAAGGNEGGNVLQRYTLP